MNINPMTGHRSDSDDNSDDTGNAMVPTLHKRMAPVMEQYLVPALT